LLGLGLEVPAFAQSTAQPDGDSAAIPLATAESPSMQPDTAEPAAPDTYRIGTNDLLAIFTFQMPELNRQVRVNDQGKVALPFLHQSVVAAGHTAAEVATDIQKDLVEEGLVRAPLVQVTVRQVLSRPIVISGAVKNSIVVQAARPVSLLEALTRAGGADPKAGDIVLVTTSGSETPTVHTYSLSGLLQGDETQNPILLGNDTVRVLPARLVYAVGALQKPGAFALEASEPLTVLKVLALTQGIKEPADKRHAELIHLTAAGTRTRTELDLDALLRHRSPDVPLLAGDILYVPENAKGKAMTAILGDLGQAAVIAFGYNAGKVF